MVFNRNSSKKGQAAIEFLMTYGWMLLVVLIVGALIFSFVDFGSLLPSKLDLSNSFKGDAQRIVATAGSTTDNLQFVVKFVGSSANQVSMGGGQQNIALDAIGGKNCTLERINTNDAEYNDSGVTTPVTFINGQEAVVTFSCDVGGSALVEGDVVEGDITIKYTDPRTSSLSLRSTGTLRVTVTK